MAPIRLYIAGPLFCEAEQEYNRRLKERLSGYGFEALLPQESGVEIPRVEKGGPRDHQQGLQVCVRF